MGLRAFTDVKSVTEFRWPLKREPFWYPLPGDADKVAATALRAFFADSLLKRLASLVKVAAGVASIAGREMRERKGCGYDYE